MQVAGRAGRDGRPARVVVQTSNPEHYSLRCAATGDYEGFYAAELPSRKAFHFPPFADLAVLTRTDGDDARAAADARDTADSIASGLLKDGIDCFFKSLAARDEKGTELFAETDSWIFEHHGNWLFSFENVCETLGIDASCLRARLRRWKEEELARRNRRRARVHWIGQRRIPSQLRVSTCASKMVAVAGG